MFDVVKYYIVTESKVLAITSSFNVFEEISEELRFKYEREGKGHHEVYRYENGKYYHIYSAAYDICGYELQAKNQVDRTGYFKGRYLDAIDDYLNFVA